MAAVSPRRGAALAALLACGAAGAQLLTLTEDDYGPGRIPLGYPVPLPVDSQTPVDGFRSHASLSARLAALALAHDDIARVVVGQSIHGRAIEAYRLGDADTLTADGFAEPAALVNGGIHAREWASPEVVAGLIERYAERADDGGFYRYLLDTLDLVVVPVLNVDGFVHTQRHPQTTLVSEFAGDDAPDSGPAEYRHYPRDGRLRRKNLRGVDATACPAADAGCMLGVDLNRNNAPYYGSGVQNSGDARSLLYRGASAGSEPEAQALYAAAALLARERLRFYVDTHSFSRLFFGLDTGNARRDAVTRALAERMSAATGGNDRYPYDPTPSGTGIGSTDEHFGLGGPGPDDDIPAYTLEIEPGVAGAQDYGGYGYHHDGFILPEAEIARVRAELADAFTVGLYRMAGPPTLIAARIVRSEDGQVVFAARWQRSGSARTLQIDAREPLATDTDYRLWLAFDKPMRVRNAAGSIVAFRGQMAPLSPAIAIEGLSASGAAFRHDLLTTPAGWRAAGAAADGALRYADDAYAIDFRLPASLPLASAQRLNLRVEAQDLSGQALDAHPASAVDWSGGWSGYEDELGDAGSDRGGPDRSLRLVDDGSPPFGSGAAGGSSGGGGALAVWALLAAAGIRLLVAAARTRRRR